MRAYATQLDAAREWANRYPPLKSADAIDLRTKRVDIFTSNRRIPRKCRSDEHVLSDMVIPRREIDTPVTKKGTTALPESHVDILIVGGGTGGVAAALAATALGKQVILTEATDWVGGQLTSQAVPPDEHRWIESFGCTASYRRFRQLVRQYYKDHYPLGARAQASATLNPGNGSVSRLCAEPRVYLAALESMMAYAIVRGHLQVRLRCKAVAAETEGDRVRSVTLLDMETGRENVVHADYVLDATELGDMLKLAGVEYVSGAESQDQTGELHARAEADAENVQALTWCFAVGYDPAPDANHTIDRPDFYARWRDYNPGLTPAWPGEMLSWTYTHPVSLQPFKASFDPAKGEGSLWRYRRLVGRTHYAPGYEPHEVALVNWPQNDYLEGNIIDQDEETIARYLSEARQLSLSLFYWLQTEAPRADGGTGFSELYLRPDIMGTADGLAKAPYIRESRRIRSRFVVTEQHIGQEARGQDQAAVFKDSVGIGSYRIDLHPSTGRDNYIDIPSLPFQIPLGALIPERVENLLPACKNIGSTHISNGCYRLHPVEWNIGEAAGALAAFCLEGGYVPHQVYESEKLTEEFQDLLRAQGVELEWPQVHPV